MNIMKVTIMAHNSHPRKCPSWLIAIRRLTNDIWRYKEVLYCFSWVGTHSYHSEKQARCRVGGIMGRVGDEVLLDCDYLCTSLSIQYLILLFYTGQCNVNGYDNSSSAHTSVAMYHWWPAILKQMKHLKKLWTD